MTNREAHEVIFKACVNFTHWKRTAMRYLKRNAPDLYERAITEFKEHPDGRGKTITECPKGMVDTCCGIYTDCHLEKNDVLRSV